MAKKLGVNKNTVRSYWHRWRGKIGSWVIATNVHQGARQLNAELLAPAVPVAPHRILVDAQLLGHHQGVLSFFEVGDDQLAQCVDAPPGLEGFRELDSQLPEQPTTFNLASSLTHGAPLRRLS